MHTLEGQGKVTVAAFRFIGDLVELDEDELPRLVQRHVGKTLSFRQLQQVADDVSRYLRKKGYSLAHVYPATRDIENGVVQLTVLLGRVESDAYGSGIAVHTVEGKLHDDGESRIDKRQVRSTIAAVTVAESLYLKMRGLERGLLLLNDLPGVRAQAHLDPGSEPGTTRLSVDIADGPLWSGSAWIDNFSNRYTGAERLNARLNVNNPAGNGDQAVVQASVADRLHIARLGYSVPVGYEGARLSAGYTDMAYSIGKEFSALDMQGDANVIDVNLAYPLIRSRRYNLFTGVAYDHIAMHDESLGAMTANKRSEAWNLVFDGNAIDDAGAGGETRYGARVRFGKLDLSRLAASFAADRVGPHRHGSYNKANYRLSRLQRFPENWSVFASVEGQLADRNLDSSEQFILGGVSGVRAYPTGEGRGNSGWLSRVEVRYDLAGTPSLGDWQFVVFFDTGSVKLHKGAWPGWNIGNPGLPESYRLSGSGVGVNLTKLGSHVIRAMYARTMGSNPGRSVTGDDSDGKHDEGRFWVQSTVYF